MRGHVSPAKHENKRMLCERCAESLPAEGIAGEAEVVGLGGASTDQRPTKPQVARAEGEHVRRGHSEGVRAGRIRPARL